MNRPRRFSFYAGVTGIIATIGFSTPSAEPIGKPVQDAGPVILRTRAQAEKLRGPFKSMESVCASLRRTECKQLSEYGWGGEHAPPPRSVCSQIEVQVKGSLRPPYLDVRGVRATCGLENGQRVGQVRLVIHTADGWYLGPQQLEELDDRKVSEQTILLAISPQEVEGAQLLVSPVRHRCMLVPAKLHEGAHELTMDTEQLVIVGTGPAGRLSALTYQLGSAMSLRTMPDPEEAEATGAGSKKRSPGPQTVMDDLIDIGWHILPGPSLRLDEPQSIQRVKPSRTLPKDLPCAESSTFGQRLKHARRLSGVYPLSFQ